MSPRTSAPIVTRRPSVAPPSPLDDLSWDSDRVLVVRAASGDDRAFALIVTRYSGLLRQVAYRALGSTDDIDDVVQETFLAAWTHADSVIDGESIAGWLVTTARRRSYDRLRTAAVRTRDGDPFEHRMLAADQPDPDDSARRSSLAADARRVLDAMPDAQRRCWHLRQLDDLSYDEIARRLSLPVSTVRGMIARARALLAIELAHWR
ncbi:RNA polymerase sigma factor [Herbiconiux flava]|uniref:RNA polymerase sigma-70 factor (ECF subfamily) n=1 Tax=Herbiconiux flava TaxID=881268 RepID=A0A852STQ6_9MICO|nr:RNA polymerase sigma factor [Herbiconiux flava]NYD72181.1 RNA polymerase sigma-70 factor (ECF subfamily) [Herbiconiux flava]GLK17855.1 putative RNA polymerase sigma factor [Herbiconiux flava]